MPNNERTQHLGYLKHPEIKNKQLAGLLIAFFPKMCVIKTELKVNLIANLIN